MAELNEATAATCASNVKYGPIPLGVEGTYSVSWGLERNPERAGALYGPHCTCPGFKFRRTCKHIAALEEVRCAWNAALDPGIEAGENCAGGKVCPRCGGPLEFVRVGV